jgi:hypothetical protein
MVAMFPIPFVVSMDEGGFVCDAWRSAVVGVGQKKSSILSFPHKFHYEQVAELFLYIYIYIYMNETTWRYCYA